MNYLNLSNPIVEDVTNCYKGENYTIKANSKESYPADVANWFVSVYPFMSCSEVEKITPKKVKEEVEEKVKEVSPKTKK